MAKLSLIKLTASEPTLLPADSKERAVTVQNIAVRSADSSPIRDSNINLKHKIIIQKSLRYY